MKLNIDLHIHSCLSPCADDEMTPNNIVNMAYIKGLDVIGITDHNSMENVEAIIKVAKQRNILVVPGIEVTTKEEIHVLCYFNNLSDGIRFQEIIYEGLPNIKNRSELFGKQLKLDEHDNLMEEIENFLLSSTKYSISEINKIVSSFDGIMIPAHVDKKSYSVLSNLGFIPNDLYIKTLEVSNNCDINILGKYIDLSKYNIIKNSDAHFLKDINEPFFFLHPEEKTIESVISYLKEKWRIEI